jgi:hypothetical protein
MQLISDEVDGSFYIDAIISPAELQCMKQQEMICGEMIIKRRKYYLAIRLKGIWDYEEEDREDEERDFDSDET